MCYQEYVIFTASRPSPALVKIDVAHGMEHPTGLLLLEIPALMAVYMSI